MRTGMPSLLAIAAHPDDIEFCMAGTMLAMRARGWELHGFNVCLGNLGSATIPGSELAEIRAREARASAALMGASWHAPCAPDLGVFYDAAMIRRVAAVVRPARPSVILTHSPEDYMEDHMVVSRLAVTAAFARGMPNLVTGPPVPSGEWPVRICHALPHGLRDGMGHEVARASGSGLEWAERWRRRMHLGFCDEAFGPLGDLWVRVG